MKKFIIIFSLVALFCLRMPRKVAAEEISLAANAKSAILIEAKTGKVIYSKNEQLRLPPASMTKIMTLSIIMNSIESGQLKWDEKITTSAYASSITGSRIFLSKNEVMPFEDMFKSIIIASANDASVAVAERIAGSEKVFVKMMNEKVAELGLKNTLFQDSTGLTSKNHYSSAYDMALMGRNLINNHGETIFKYSTVYEDYVRKDTSSPFWLVNTNRLVKTNPEVDGLKTGWTEEAGYCITATMMRNDMRLIAVVMGEPDSNTRNEEVLELLNYGFGAYEVRKQLDEKTLIKNYVDYRFTPYKLNITLDKPLYIVEKKGIELKKITYKTEIFSNKIDNLETENIGYLHVYYDNVLYEKIPLSLEEPIKKSSVIDLCKVVLRKILL